MTIEEKAKAYDEVVNKLKGFMTQGVDPLITRADVQDFFPELKEESEDERIRHEIKIILANTDLSQFALDYTFTDMIAWLEKQGEQKETLCDKCKKEQPSHSCQDITALGRCALEMQGKKKSADKVEPKFHEGEWITDGEKVMKIGYIEDDMYIEHRGTISAGGAIESIDKHYHLWNIQDAKDGDVLVNDFQMIFIFKEIKNNIYISHCSVIDRENDTILNSIAEREVGNVNLVKCLPATKEQREQLKRVIAEAGYKWNPYEKKMEKIEQNPAWSDEDEIALNDALWCCEQAASIAKNENDMGNAWYAENWLKSLKNRVQPKQEWSEEDEIMLENIIDDYDDEEEHNLTEGLEKVMWLKALKSRVQLQGWKPSDEQMQVLRWCMPLWAEPKSKAILESLINDLKKLREEDV